jgi:hypothetical protein
MDVLIGFHKDLLHDIFHVPPRWCTVQPVDKCEEGPFKDLDNLRKGRCIALLAGSNCVRGDFYHALFGFDKMLF